MSKKNAKSPDDQLVQDMNKGNLTPDEKARDLSYLDPITHFGSDKKLKRTGFGVTKLFKTVDELITRFENPGKINKITAEKILPLTEEEEKDLEKKLKELFKATITPLTADEVKDYGLTEYVYLRRAVDMRTARANGITPEEFLKREKEQREVNVLREKAESEMTITAMKSGDTDFLKDLLELMKRNDF